MSELLRADQSIELDPSFEEGVVMASLLNPPAQNTARWGISYSLTSSARKTPGSLTPDWDVRETREQQSIEYVPMNKAAVARFVAPGYLGTTNLNGCMAAVAGYRGKRNSANAFLGHYDLESSRTLDEDGASKFGKLITEFAGENAVKVCVAYSKDHNSPRTNESYDREDFPVDALMDECAKLPNGSRVLFVPYQTSTDFEDAATGHMLHIGLDGSYGMEFGWNGHPIDVGNPEVFDESRRSASRAYAADTYTGDDYEYLMLGDV